MTVLRREDVQSRVASWDGRPCRIASSPILAIVPLIIRRLRGPSPQDVVMMVVSFRSVAPSLVFVFVFVFVFGRSARRL